MKSIFTYALITIISFIAGYFTYQKTQTDLIESHNFKIELIDAQNAALEKAEIVMDNNNLFDTDGSDEMEEYLNICNKVDSLWKTQL